MSAVDDLSELVERAGAAERAALASKWKDRPDVDALRRRVRRVLDEHPEAEGRAGGGRPGPRRAAPRGGIPRRPAPPVPVPRRDPGPVPPPASPPAEHDGAAPA